MWCLLVGRFAVGGARVDGQIGTLFRSLGGGGFFCFLIFGCGKMGLGGQIGLFYRPCWHTVVARATSRDSFSRQGGDIHDSCVCSAIHSPGGYSA